MVESRVDYVGHGRAPVLVIENAWPDAISLRETAAQRDRLRAMNSTGAT